ncbi:hypothetical protein V5O48_009148 [Marasmius crinis-equi]|uniref:STB6-like N-terminal domain-containing protein n=1 Tax=Marasmius crinis-equi TaxID=585013 RepID=A0ABR3FC39_9AGAR
MAEWWDKSERTQARAHAQAEIAEYGFPMLHPASQGIELNGYQLYAVQRWVLQRRPRPFLVVHTGDPVHRIHVVQSEEDGDDKANIHARPKDTPHGTIMVTSLAHFPSDYTILLIPNGDFNDRVRDELYRNMVLQRLGLSGRSALTLQVPSDATKQRFVSAYHFPETTKSDESFTPSVLELIRQVQAALVVFGLYDGPMDGLLCDQTTVGIRSWVHDVGGAIKGLETSSASSRTATADPATVSAMLSLVLAVRNRLVGLSPHNQVPKDPFLTPHSFIHSIRRHVSNPNDHPKPQHSHTYSLPAVPTINTLSITTLASPKVSTPHLTPQVPPLFPTAGSSPYLSRSLVQSIFATHDAKIPKTKGTYYREREQEKEKESPLAALHLSSLAALSGSQGPHSILDPTVDLTEFVHTVVGRNRLKEKEKEKEKEKDKEKEKERDKAGHESDDLLAQPLSPSAGSPNSPSTPTTHNSPSTSRATKVKPLKPKTKGSKDSDVTGVAGTMRGLWSGNILGVIRLRERVAEREREREKEKEQDAILGSGDGAREKKGIYSDGDTDYNYNFDSMRSSRAPRMSRRGSLQEKSDGRSTEEEGYGNGDSFGSRWARSSEKFSNVRDKIESWTLNKIDTKLAKRKAPTHHSNASTSTANIVDLSPTTATPGGSFSSKKPHRISLPGRSLIPTFGNDSANNSTVLLPTNPVSPAQSPSRLLPAFGEADPDDDDTFLSSGQVSPVSDDPRTPKSFGMLGGMSSKTQWAKAIDKHGFSPLNLSAPPVKKSISGNESLVSGSSVSSGKYAGLGLSVDGDRNGVGVGKRPWGNRLHLANQRVTSWSDPVSARGKPDEGTSNDDSLEQGESGDDLLSDLASGDSEMVGRHRGERSSELTRIHVRVVSEDGGSVKELEEYHEPPVVKRKVAHGPRRRRSFHSLSTFKEGDIRILPVERMRIDVELAGYYLIMHRREEHLRNVIATLQVLTNRLSSTNAHLRSHYENHLSDLSLLNARSKVVAEIEADHDGSIPKITQATNTLKYEGQQFLIDEIWRGAASSRKQVFEYRGKVFAKAGGRRLPPGVQGAHGPFNRLQWTLDGQERLVDVYGRTESEAEEEDNADPLGEFRRRAEDEEVDVVEHPGIKPMWLLRFFTRWWAVWGRVSTTADHSEKADASEAKETKAPLPSPPTTPISSESLTPKPSPLPVPEKAKSL